VNQQRLVQRIDNQKEGSKSLFDS